MTLVDMGAGIVESLREMTKRSITGAKVNAEIAHLSDDERESLRLYMFKTVEDFSINKELLESKAAALRVEERIYLQRINAIREQADIELSGDRKALKELESRVKQQDNLIHEVVAVLETAEGGNRDWENSAYKVHATRTTYLDVEDEAALIGWTIDIGELDNAFPRKIKKATVNQLWKKFTTDWRNEPIPGGKLRHNTKVSVDSALSNSGKVSTSTMSCKRGR